MTMAQKAKEKNTYEIWVANDAMPHTQVEGYKTWFYFSVTGVPQGEQLFFKF